MIGHVLSKVGKGSTKANTGLTVLGEPALEFMSVGAVKTTRATNAACHLEDDIIGDTDGREWWDVAIVMKGGRCCRLGCGMFGE
jgi:hypothetical protein